MKLHFNMRYDRCANVKLNPLKKRLLTIKSTGTCQELVINDSKKIIQRCIVTAYTNHVVLLAICGFLALSAQNLA